MSCSICKRLSQGIFVIATLFSSSKALGRHPNYQEIMAENNRSTRWDHIPLIDTEGKSFTGDEHRGKLILIDFFFSSCPNICAPQTAGLVKVWNKLGKQEKQSIIFLSISIDPRNDSPAKLKAYKKRFGIQASSWIFATANEQTVARVSQHFGSTSGNGDPLTHKARIYLVGPDGLYLTSYESAPVDSSRLISELTQAVRVLVRHEARHSGGS